LTLFGTEHAEHLTRPGVWPAAVIAQLDAMLELRNLGRRARNSRRRMRDPRS
jgi:hypothetical protein